jgi:hypothetical protein
MARSKTNPPLGQRLPACTASIRPFFSCAIDELTARYGREIDPPTAKWSPPLVPKDVPLVWIAVAAFAALVALVQTLRIVGARWARRHTLRVRFARASEGERRAESLLESAGYEILDRQVQGSWTLHADGEPFAVALRADLLVAKGARRFIAEVKTGKLAPRLDHAPTRRQLLEYRVAFDVDGVLLVDAESDRIVEVDLSRPSQQPRPRPAWRIALAVGVTLGVAVGFAVGFEIALHLSS